MSKHLKRGVAVALALAMTTQFGLENPYVYAEGDTSKEDAETQKDPTPTEEESQETQPESAILTVDYVTEDGEVLDSHEFSGINVGDKVLAIDIEKSFDGYTLVRVEDADNEYVIGQDLTLTKPEKNIRLIYKADTKQEEITEDSKEEEPQVSPNSVTDTEDENETVYFVVHYYDENGDLIPVTTDNRDRTIC